MADKNRNGIEDSKEKPRSLADVISGKGADWSLKSTPSVENSPNNPSPVVRTYGKYDPSAANRGIDKAFPTDARALKADGTPVGRLGVAMPKGTEEAPAAAERTFASTLAEAMKLLSSLGGAGGVDYDPYRQSARTNAAEADANVGAIYRALATSIGNDAPGIGQQYDTAKQTQQAASDQASQAIQQGYQSGRDMLSQQAAALGIQEAVGNQIEAGQTGAGDMSQRLADSAAQNQTAQTQLNTNRQSALDYNTAVKQAAQQEGAAQRAQRQAELRSVLAQIDVAEQDANRSTQGRQGESALSLAQWLWGQDTDEARYQDSLQQSAIEAAMSQGAGTPGVNAESVALLQELLGYTDPAQTQQWIQKNPAGATSLFKLFAG